MRLLTHVDTQRSAIPSRSGIRQARLKPEYGSLYPTLEAGVWQPAATLADRLLAHKLLHGNDTALWGRTLVDAHFDFRRGNSHGGERSGKRCA
jgi:hypothetical protein